MAKVVFKSTPHSAYEWAEVEGGGSMSDVQRAALLDEFIEEHGLVPVETMYVGEVPRHKFGRYKADFPAKASALAPAVPAPSSDPEKDALKAEIARLKDQLGKSSPSAKNVVEGNADDLRNASGGAQTTEEARDSLSEALGVEIVGSSEEIREDMSTADRSDDNPRVDDKAKRKGK